MSETVAPSGAVPAILEALARGEDERRRLVAERATLDARQPLRLDWAAVRKQLGSFLDDFRGVLSANVIEARPVLSVVLAGDRISCRPVADGGYELKVPIAFDRMISTAIPELAVSER